MKHDIEAINAALRLGDPATPPRGTVFQLWDLIEWKSKEPLLVKIDGESLDGAMICRMVCKNLDGSLQSSPRTEVWDRFWFDTVVSVPDEAPPFEEWERM